MRGKKAKALRKIVGYHPNKDRLDAPGLINDFTPFINEKGNEVRKRGVTVGMSKDSRRKAYKFIKRRYGMIPLAQMLPRLKVGLPELAEVPA